MKFIERRMALPMIIWSTLNIEGIVTGFLFGTKVSLLGALLLVLEFLADKRWKHLWLECLMDNQYDIDDGEYGYDSNGVAVDYKSNLVIWNIVDLGVHFFAVVVALAVYIAEVVNNYNGDFWTVIPIACAIAGYLAHWSVIIKRTDLIEEECSNYRRFFKVNKDAARNYLDHCEQIH